MTEIIQLEPLFYPVNAASPPQLHSFPQKSYNWLEQSIDGVSCQFININNPMTIAAGTAAERKVKYYRVIENTMVVIENEIQTIDDETADMYNDITENFGLKLLIIRVNMHGGSYTELNKNGIVKNKNPSYDKRLTEFRAVFRTELDNLRRGKNGNPNVKFIKLFYNHDAV